MNKKLQEVQSQTWTDMVQTLEEYGYCNIERPTGFGKTKLFMDYICQYPDRQFLYIFDVTSVVEDITNKYAPSNVEFLSYTAISRVAEWSTTKAYITSKPWNAIIFDESHLMGATNTANHLKDVLPLAHMAGVQILGGTATPIRSDTQNVTKEFFGGHGVFEYTLADAIADGIMQEPYWVLTVHLKQLLSQLRKNVANNSFQVNRLNQLDRAYAKLVGVDKVYRQTVEDVFGGVPDKMQFIAFYPTILALEENKHQLFEEFQAAFPQHRIYCTAISSDPEHYSDIVEVEQEIRQANEPRTVHLILAVDMLNQAYHSNSLTGIIMNRATASNIIFTQQLGRCLSVTSTGRAIVFDNVGNANIDPDSIIESLEQVVKVQSGVRSGPRDHKELQVHVDPQILEVFDWYRRIKSTSQLTPEMVAYARRLKNDMGAPDEFVSRSLNMPADAVGSIVNSDVEVGESASSRMD